MDLVAVTHIIRFGYTKSATCAWDLLPCQLLLPLVGELVQYGLGVYVGWEKGRIYYIKRTSMVASFAQIRKLHLEQTANKSFGYLVEGDAGVEAGAWILGRMVSEQRYLHPIQFVCEERPDVDVQLGRLYFES